MSDEPNFILIDGSYFIFFRYYALLNWFKMAKKGDLQEPINNPTFVDKFKTTFVSKIQEIPKKLKIKNPIILVGKDCPRKSIWRIKYLPSYKANRVYDDTFLGGPFFRCAYEDELFIQGGAKVVFECPSLEADDCVAILAKNIVEKYPKANITIITSDMDYLQLACSNIQPIDLKYRKLTERKSSFNDAKKDLFVKILTGDKSDNIKGVFKKCGVKTACKYYDNKELFEEKLKSVEGAMERYLLNKKIIDFNEIPEELIKQFKEIYNIL